MSNLELISVLGTSISRPSGLGNYASKVAYPAGSVITFDQQVAVVQDIMNQEQRFLKLDKSIGIKPISCTSFSHDGSFIACGEQGHLPKILIWNLENELIAVLSGHKYGITAIDFSHKTNHLASIGFHADGYLYLWNFKTGQRLAGVKISTKLHGIAFDPENRYIITVGSKHVKYWNFDSSVLVGNQTLQGKSAILGEHGNCSFVDVDVVSSMNGAENSTFAYSITDNGLLAFFGESRFLDKWVDLKMAYSTCIAVSENYVACGGNHGLVRLFEPETLKYLGSLPKPDPLYTDITDGQILDGQEVIYPAVVALCIIDDKFVFVIYKNKSIILWDISNPKRATRIQCYMYHSDCIWGIKTIEQSTLNVDNKFVTWSSDGTCRFWDFENDNRDPFLSNILYADFDGLVATAENKTKVGIRSFAIEYNSKIAACGDRLGNIHIYSLENNRKLATLEADKSEILTLEFSSSKLLAAAGRDRLIHLYNCSKIVGNSSFDLVQTFDEHSSTVTCLRFSSDSRYLVSGGADKSIVFRVFTEGKYYTFSVTPLKSTVYDILFAQNRVIACTQDKRIIYLDPENGKVVASRILHSDTFISALALDPTNQFLVCGCGDKSISIFDQDLLLLEREYGHGDLITGMAYINKLNYVISCSGDGCMYLWKVGDAIRLKVEKESVALSPVFLLEEKYLPSWAREQEKEETQVSMVIKAQGRWAERVDPKGIVLFSQEQEPIVAHPIHRKYSIEQMPDVRKEETRPKHDNEISIVTPEPTISEKEAEIILKPEAETKVPVEKISNTVQETKPTNLVDPVDIPAFANEQKQFKHGNLSPKSRLILLERDDDGSDIDATIHLTNRVSNVADEIISDENEEEEVGLSHELGTMTFEEYVSSTVSSPISTSLQSSPKRELDHQNNVMLDAEKIDKTIDAIASLAQELAQTFATTRVITPNQESKIKQIIVQLTQLTTPEISEILQDYSEKLVSLVREKLSRD